MALAKLRVLSSIIVQINFINTKMEYDARRGFSLAVIRKWIYSEVLLTAGCSEVQST